MLADEMCRLVRHVQDAAARLQKTIIFAMILDRDAKSGAWEYQLHGQRTGEELRGMFDTIVALMQCVQTPNGIFPVAAVTPELSAEIRAAAELHPERDLQSIASIFGVNAGRVSEALHGLR